MVRNDDQRWKIGLDEEGAVGRASWSPGSRTGEPGSRDRAEPASPAQLSAKWIGKAVLVGEDTSQEAGQAVLQWGLWTQLPCVGRGQGQSRSKGKGSTQPPLCGRVYGTPTGLGLLPFGDERLSLPGLGVRAWVTEAALYPLGAGAVTWSRSEDIVSAWG